jgi:type I restriction enzyme S subunit
MELKAGYKLTEVGVIPEEWAVGPLKGKINIAHGFPFESRYFDADGPYRLTTPGHFYEEGGFRDVGDKQKYYNGPVPKAYLLHPGDLLVAMTEQADGLLGSAAIIPENDGYLHNQRLGRVAALSIEIDSRFLFYVFNSIAYRSKVRETAAGTKVKHTSPKKLLEIPTALPPPHEQRVIASALTDVDALIADLDRIAAKKRGLKHAAMQQLLTGEKRLPGFRGEWKVKRLGEVAEIDVDNLASDTPPSYAFKYISLEDVNTGSLRSYSEQRFGFAPSRARRRLREGDVLVSTVRPNLQSHLRFASTEPNWVCSTGFSVIRAKSEEIDSTYIFYHLFGDHVVKQIEALLAGSNYPAINGSDVKALEIPVPPLPEQRAIATVLSDMDAELYALEQRRDKTRALKQGMMQELLTGRTRLV